MPRGKSVLDRPVVEVRIVFADGEQESRFWTIHDNPHPDPDQPDWMREPRKSWQHPQDPVIYSCLVAGGREDEARAWLAAL